MASTFDGQHVDVYQGRFTGPFDLDEVEGTKIEHDDIVTMLVTGVVKKVGVDSTKDGQLRRTNTISVLQAIPMTEQQLSKAAIKQILGPNAGGLLEDDDDDDDDDRAEELTAQADSFDEIRFADMED